MLRIVPFSPLATIYTYEWYIIMLSVQNLCAGTHSDAQARLLHSVAQLPSSEDQPHK